MIWLVLGVALWSGAHLFKRLAPQARAKMGDAGKGVVAVALLISVVMMVVGYRGWDSTVFWGRNPALVGINNLLILLAIYLFVVSGAKLWITTKIRNPQLTAVKLWALAHLLVNGDVASFVLFGGLMAWAVVEVIVLKRSAAVFVPEKGWPIRTELQALLATVVVMALISAVHIWLGYNPFG